MELKDFTLTELIGFRTYFKKLEDDIAEQINFDIGVSNDDRSKLDLINENLQFLDKFIVRTFQSIKLNTELPEWIPSEENSKS